MKNLAGNEVSIFLFQFILQKSGIRFVLNESIAEDMYPEIDKQMQPLAQACGETLSRYRSFSHSEIIMDGNLLTDGCFEVMLSKGLGIHIPESEKQNLFNDAHAISELLMEVMDRRTLEQKDGTYPGPQKIINKILPMQAASKGMEALGEKQHLIDQLIFGISPSKPGTRRLKPDDLPNGVLAKRGYDHRGHCIAFEHISMGEIGKIVLVPIAENQMRIEAELTKGNQESLSMRHALLEEVFTIVSDGLERIRTQ